MFTPNMRPKSRPRSIPAQRSDPSRRDVHPRTSRPKSHLDQAPLNEVTRREPMFTARNMPPQRVTSIKPPQRSDPSRLMFTPQHAPEESLSQSGEQWQVQGGGRDGGEERGWGASEAEGDEVGVERAEPVRRDATPTARARTAAARRGPLGHVAGVDRDVRAAVDGPGEGPRDRRRSAGGAGRGTRPGRPWRGDRLGRVDPRRLVGARPRVRHASDAADSADDARSARSSSVEVVGAGEFVVAALQRTRRGPGEEGPSLSTTNPSRAPGVAARAQHLHERRGQGHGRADADRRPVRAPPRRRGARGRPCRPPSERRIDHGVRPVARARCARPEARGVARDAELGRPGALVAQLPRRGRESNSSNDSDRPSRLDHPHDDLGHARQPQATPRARGRCATTCPECRARSSGRRPWRRCRPTSASSRRTAGGARSRRWCRG